MTAAQPTSAAPRITIDEIGGSCPVQANGTIDGVPFYFRARGEHWSIEIGEGNTHLVVEAMRAVAETRAQVEAKPVWTYAEPYKSWPEAGYMPEDEARAFIASAAARWIEESARATP